MEKKLPDQFTKRMKEQLGDKAGLYFKSMDEPPVKALRLNMRKIKPVEYTRMSRIFTGSDIPESVPYWPAGFYYDDNVAPGRSPYHAAGAYYIQEPSAMLPVTFAGIAPGQKVIDLCAAPGGKTTMIADLMEGHGLLVANEIIPSRASVLSENIERLGVTNSLLICADPTVLAGRFPSFFDRILVDAPCSGEGMFRKDDVAISEWSVENVAMCANRQDMILDCAAAMLAPGGKIVYSTCTFSPEEDEGSVERFLKRHPEFTLCESPKKVYPHTIRGEGHFAAAFERKVSASSADAADKKAAGTYRDMRISSEYVSILNDFASQTFSESSEILTILRNDKDRLIMFGDSVYLAPEYMPDIKGIKVLRAGLKIGCFKKNRFEPDHALSHALVPSDAKNSIELDPSGNEIKQYLSGMTVGCDNNMKGWCLVCTGGYAVGWGKASGGVLKNHYPKGLRTVSA